jgi:hypothetical protein
LGVVDGGERHRLGGVEDAPGDCGHLKLLYRCMMPQAGSGRRRSAPSWSRR